MTTAQWVNHQAHHIIPKEFWNHPIIQKAASSGKNTFHMNHPRNDVPIHKSQHNGSHQHYSDQIEAFLDGIDINLSPSEIADILKNRQDELLDVLKNTTEHINNIIL